MTRGTAAGAQIRGLTIAGKTGTAQNPPHPDNAWFVGFAPADEPKIVVAVILEEGLHGIAAAKVATKMMERLPQGAPHPQRGDGRVGGRPVLAGKASTIRC